MSLMQQLEYCEVPLRLMLTVCKHNFSRKQKSWTFIGLVEFTLLDI